MIGNGTGGYITLASSTISDYNDIILDDAERRSPSSGTIQATAHSSPWSSRASTVILMTTDTYAPASSGGFQLCAANHVGYSSEFDFQMNAGGALGDLNWLDEGDIPMVSFQCPHDPFAPYETAVLIVPTTNEPVVEVSGAMDIHEEINGYATNNNAILLTPNS